MTSHDPIEITLRALEHYLDNNHVDAMLLPALIRDTYAVVTEICNSRQPSLTISITTKLQPVVPIETSVHPDTVTCLECGARLTMLRRHLWSAHGLTPSEYLAKWNLSPDYPLTAPNYSAKRSELAKQSGLGGNHRAAEGLLPDHVDKRPD